MKAVLIVACCLAVALAGPLTERQYQTAFQGFAERFNKNYDVSELFHRFAIFKDNLDFINTENGKNLTYTLGVNEFSDLTHAEFVATFLGRRSSIKSKGLVRDSAVPNHTGANAIDWRDKGAVTPVKNQGSCGSCWAFSATGGIESAHFVASGKLINLAEQQMVDCCRGSSCGGSMGCNGGEEADAMEWVSHNKDSAQCASEDYPYTARDGTCKKTCKPVVNIAGVKRVIGEPALVAALNIVPTTVAVDASARGWQSYSGGVFDTTCSRRLNHAILAVGYTDTYWMVKNSWGASWGDKGYINMIRGKNLCGIDDEPAYAF